MKFFLQVIFFAILCVNVANANDFREIKKISLKKDEQKKILVKYDTTQRLFKFRWTLYINGGLVIFRSYDKRVAQNILYLNHKNQSFRVELKPRGADFYDVPYILVKFKEFDYKKRVAKFDLMLSDTREQIVLEDLDKKK